ncbi:small GTP-binding protein domain-containing protein [Noviherbaspirillum humi]|uniref:Small GTP-binding protein domain-containing protein n=1 Tax=Noviherbaspirillum humi TaxID=1688639 RepID=A0A239KLB4_9BURK|nr:GTPase/DUF3482 domain-containing protein [Noviherbaspirillum humi]SNT18393.1 small GTP-binding protein domain-containing protein [Noviherbaspirillum humi]
MPEALQAISVAVVGHTNAGKTSLLRTLTRNVHFGEVSDRPGTTRHVEAIELRMGGVSAVRFFDTPGLEDSVALLDYLKALENCPTPPDRVRVLLDGPEARRSFEQEAKVLRQMLETEAAIYVIDTREPVLPKFRAEIEILTFCARPILPVLNFVRHPASRKGDWLETLSAYNLHAHVEFDAVAPFVGSERELYHDLAILLRHRRELLLEVVRHLGQQFDERRAAGCRLIADMLVDMAALRLEVPREEIADAQRKAEIMRGFRERVVRRMRRGIEDLLQVYGFRQDDADVAVLPWLDGRWETDIFNPETLRDAGRRLGTGAAVGAAIGLVADLATAGLSLGAASAIGATLGGLASQGWGQFGRKLAGMARGMQDLTLENELLLAAAQQMLGLLRALERRGHAAMDKLPEQRTDSRAADDHLNRLAQALQPARSHPEWAIGMGGRGRGNAARERFAEEVALQLKQMVEPGTDGG